jgi:hypothetical protein
MTEGTVNQQRGLLLAGATGVVAVATLWRWPGYKHDILVGLMAVWSVISYSMMSGLRGAWKLTFRELHEKIRTEGYRSSISSKVFLVAVLALMIYTTLYT